MLLPQQKNTYKEKTKKVYNADGLGYRTWAMDCVDFYIEQSSFDSHVQEAKGLQNAVEGIIDPAKVTKTAIKSAVSVAGLLLTAACGIVDIEE